MGRRRSIGGPWDHGARYHRVDCCRRSESEARARACRAPPSGLRDAGIHRRIAAVQSRCAVQPAHLGCPSCRCGACRCTGRPLLPAGTCGTVVTRAEARREIRIPAAGAENLAQGGSRHAGTRRPCRRRSVRDALHELRQHGRPRHGNARRAIESGRRAGVRRWQGLRSDTGAVLGAGRSAHPRIAWAWRPARDERQCHRRRRDLAIPRVREHARNRQPACRNAAGRRQGPRRRHRSRRGSGHRHRSASW